MDIDKLFDYHPSDSDENVKIHKTLRHEVKTTAEIFDAELPESAEKTLAVRKLQEALMWANACVAINL